MKAVAAQTGTTGGDTAALEQQVAKLGEQVSSLTARAATAEAKASQTQEIANGYLSKIKAAQAALEG